MHNLKSIRENPDIFRKKISSRNVDVNLDELLNLDKKKQRNNTEKGKTGTRKKNHI